MTKVSKAEKRSIRVLSWKPFTLVGVGKDSESWQQTQTLIHIVSLVPAEVSQTKDARTDDRTEKPLGLRETRA